MYISTFLSWINGWKTESNKPENPDLEYKTINICHAMLRLSKLHIYRKIEAGLLVCMQKIHNY